MNQNPTNTRPGMQTCEGPETRTYYAQHDFDGPAKLSTTLIHALSEVANIDMTGTESTLFQHVDPEALDSIFRPAGPDAPRANGHVSFMIWGYNVTIYSDGYIVIALPRQPVHTTPAGSPQQRGA